MLEKMNEARVCITCGAQYPVSYIEDDCLICEDDRQYIPLMASNGPPVCP